MGFFRTSIALFSSLSIMIFEADNQ